MLLGRHCLKDAKVTHNWGNNVIIVQGSRRVRTISGDRKLGVKTRRPPLLVRYDLMEGLIDEEKDLIFETKPKLFLIGTIILSEKNGFVVECWTVKN